MEMIRETKVSSIKDREYKYNPSVELVGHLLKETKRTIRTNKVRIGKIEGKLTKIATDDREYVYQDDSKFIKVFLDSDALNEFIDLSSSAQKVLCSIIKTMKYNEDFVYVYNHSLLKDTGLSDTSISLGKKELLEKEWLFKSDVNHMYWINLCYICIGNRDEIYRKFIVC